MTKNKKSLVTDNDQLSLLDLLRQEREERQFSRPGRLNMNAQISAAIKAGIRKAPKSREAIAEEMEELAGERITVCMINNWTADSHPHDMPGRFYSAFCAATGDVELIRLLAEGAGVFMLPGPDALRAEIQKLDEQSRELQAQKKKRLLFLQELEGKR
ncbi:MAG: hypothetical protein A2075_12025 [Geobacteraceae bacterium GWC2_58_44]|nr:MAG: hypothetical protein A2075_12025 [Geobacteraceae bacterium GWC2_58_44]HBG06290.1 hypothetical protein [Geobacter sp.]